MGRVMCAALQSGVEALYCKSQTFAFSLGTAALPINKGATKRKGKGDQ